MTQPVLFEQFIGTTEAARQLGVNARTIGRWVADGLMRPAVKLPGKTGAFVFTPEEVARARRHVGKRRKAAKR